MKIKNAESYELSAMQSALKEMKVIVKLLRRIWGYTLLFH